MKKKIMLFLMILISGISFSQTAFASVGIRAYLYDFSSNTSIQGGNDCYFSVGVSIDYSLSQIPSNPYVGESGAPLILGTVSGGLLPEYVGDLRASYQGGIALSYGSGYWGQPCNQQTLQWLQQLQQEVESQAISEKYYVAGYLANADGSLGTLVQSNVAQLVNPVNAPIASPVNSPAVYGLYYPIILAPYKLLTLTKDPINIATGEDYFSSTDFSLGGRGPKLALFRRYRSFSTFSGIFGYGWRTDFDVNLTTDSAGDVTIFDGEGTGTYFMNNSGTYIPSPGNYSTLAKNADNTYTVTDKNGNVTHYDITGRLTSRTDRNGNALTFVYNPAQVGGTYIQDASNRKIVLSIDANGHVIAAVDPAGKTYQYGYDVNANLVSITDPTGAVTNYDYDSNHKIIQFTNANGHNTYYQYNAQGQATMNWQDNNVNKVTLNYGAGNYTTVVTDSLGNNNTYVFNNSGLLTSRTDPLGAMTREVWDPDMELTTIIDAKNNMTNWGYDINGNLAQVTDPIGYKTTMTYTPNFNLISSKTDALNDLTAFAYDNNGNLTAITDALGNNHSFVYDQYGNVITATDSRGNSANFTYDNFSHIIQKTDALGNNTFFTYE